MYLCMYLRFGGRTLEIKVLVIEASLIRVSYSVNRAETTSIDSHSVVLYKSSLLPTT